jgi:hypothetical protein
METCGKGIPPLFWDLQRRSFWFSEADVVFESPSATFAKFLFLAFKLLIVIGLETFVKLVFTLRGATSAGVEAPSPFDETLD